MCGGHGAIRSYSGDVPSRVIVLALALLMAAGVASPTGMAAPDVTAAVDVAPDADPAITETAVTFEGPDRRELRQFATPSDASPGRLHRISIFRPPRGVASR